MFSFEVCFEKFNINRGNSWFTQWTVATRIFVLDEKGEVGFDKEDKNIVASNSWNSTDRKISEMIIGGGMVICFQWWKTKHKFTTCFHILALQRINLKLTGQVGVIKVEGANIKTTW